MGGYQQGIGNKQGQHECQEMEPEPEYHGMESWAGPCWAEGKVFWPSAQPGDFLTGFALRGSGKQNYGFQAVRVAAVTQGRLLSEKPSTFYRRSTDPQIA